MFFTFEGIDGCGKSTQVGLLRDYFLSAGREVVVTREPGGTALAEAVRNYLLHSEQPLEPRAELLLFGASRAQHVAEIIRPALGRGAIVLCDRFADSSLAYQGAGLGLPTDFIRQMNAFATGGLQPDKTFLLDVDVAIGQARRAAQRGEDRIEARGLEFQEKVRQGYLTIAQTEPQRFVILDAGKTPDVIHQAILAALR